MIRMTGDRNVGRWFQQRGKVADRINAANTLVIYSMISDVNVKEDFT